MHRSSVALNLLVATLTIHRKKEEANVDWGFFAGRAIFRCLGDAGLARRAIMDHHGPEIDARPSLHGIQGKPSDA